MEIIRCPDLACNAPAEIEDRWYQESTHGAVEHLKTRCLDRHVFTMTTDALPDCLPQTESRRSQDSVSRLRQALGRPPLP